MTLAIAIGLLALAVVFGVQATASLRRSVTVMGLMTAATAASTAAIGVVVLLGGI